MIEKDIKDISVDDIESLKTNGVSEGKTIEYKSQLPDNTNESIVKLLKNVSAFANTNGGDLIYGIKESKGKPISIDGVAIPDVDKEKLRIENIIRNRIEPRIPNVYMQEILLSNGRYIFIIRTLKSWNSPHRVDNFKFYGRNSVEAFPLDVSDLKTAFLLTENISNRIKNFIADRITAIYSDNTPIPLEKGAKAIMHLIPLSAFTQNELFSIEDCRKRSDNLRPLGDSWTDYKINLDGFINYGGREKNLYNTYAILYRTGIIETIEKIRLFNDLFVITKIENDILKFFNYYLNIYKELKIESPVYIFISLLGLKGHELYTHSPLIPPDIPGKNKIDRDLIQLPELILESFDVDAPTIFKPIFDMIWNAWGYERCFNYDNDGNRIS